MEKVVTESIKANQKLVTVAEKYILEKYRERKRNRLPPKVNAHNAAKSTAREKTNGLRGISKFKEAARIVRIFISVCNRLIRIAAEHGKYSILKSDANVELHSAAAGSFQGNDDENLLFDPGMYKSKSEAPVPAWVIEACLKSAEERTNSDLRKLCCLMKQMEIFQKYTKGMLNLMAKAATWSRFDSGRVVIRKGHPGRTIYVILNGSVALLENENEETSLKPQENLIESNTEDSKRDAVLRKGDCFGREAFFKNMERQSTAVCLSLTHFLMVNLDDVNEVGLEEYLSQEIMTRYKFLRLLPLFEKLPDEKIRLIADRSQTYEYLADKIIEKDSGCSEFVYICRKGQCTILRKINKKRSKEFASRKRSESLADESVNSFLPLTIPCHSVMKARDNTSTATELKRLPELTMHLVKSRNLISRRYPQDLSDKSTESLWGKVAKKSLWHSSFPKHRYSMGQIRTDVYNSRSRIDTGFWAKKDGCRLPIETPDGLVVQVAQLSKGDVFGLGDGAQEVITSNERRNFILVSSGCEVIAIKRQTLLQNLNCQTIDIIRTTERAYASDDELYSAFCEQMQWKSYREQLVGRLLKWRGSSSNAKTM